MALLMGRIESAFISELMVTIWLDLAWPSARATHAAAAQLSVQEVAPFGLLQLR